MKRSHVHILMALLCLLTLPLQSISQSKSEKRKIAYDHIKALESSVLLVRLKTKDKTLEALRENQHFKTADAMEKEIMEKNREIIQAFNDHFKFCPVYFFYSSDSKYIYDNQLDSINYLNDQLETDASIRPEFTTFYIAEYGNIEQRPSNSKDQNSEDKVYTGQTDFGFGALVIRDSNFTQLARPFPYYSRTYEDIIFVNRTPATVVRKMNEQLFEFLNSIP